ncbi:GAF domain-containing protein [Paenibacillus athensensis]|nr:GAF domain-containing protein [Paenibacillus athensensis]MCD1258589.1 GAF domain-containing protein [Paenibacillus athensensis]
MDSFEAQLLGELERLRVETGSDVAAYAAPARRSPLWGWVRVAGEVGRRFVRMAVQPGRGLVGAALRTGRAVVLDRHRDAADLRREDAALLLTERLIAAAAAPVLRDGHAVGLLLLASRRERDYGVDDVRLLTESALRLGETSVAGTM